MSQIRSYPEHVTFIFRHKVSISKDKMSPNQTFSMENILPITFVNSDHIRMSEAYG